MRIAFWPPGNSATLALTLSCGFFSSRSLNMNVVTSAAGFSCVVGPERTVSSFVLSPALPAHGLHPNMMMMCVALGLYMCMYVSICSVLCHLHKYVCVCLIMYGLNIYGLN